METISVIFGLSLFAAILLLMAASMATLLRYSDRPDRVLGVHPVKRRIYRRRSARSGSGRPRDERGRY